MKHNKFIFFPVLILGLQGMTLGKSSKAEIASINAYCSSVDVLSKKAKGPDLIFAEASDSTIRNAKSKWRKFIFEKSLEKFREKSETYSIAYNWRRDGKIVASNFTNFSGSGDWAMYIFHCYRADGTLARVRSELRTFYGDYIVTQTRYFNGRGKQISKRVKYQDLTTKKVKRPSYENDQYFTDEGVFRTTATLPFAKLLTNK